MKSIEVDAVFVLKNPTEISSHELSFSQPCVPTLLCVPPGLLPACSLFENDTMTGGLLLATPV